LKLVTYLKHNKSNIGVIENNHVFPIPNTPDLITFLRELSPVELVESALKGNTTGVPLAKVRLLAPIPRPPKIICLGLNYADHAEETGRPLPVAPILFSKAPTAVIGPGDAIVLPENSQVDYEVELAVIIGKGGRHIPENQALDHVGGYTIFNDVSARNYQYRDRQWFRGKSFDTFAPMGPCLVLADQIPEPQNLRLQLRLNNSTLQDSTTANMIFKIPQILSDISSVLTLETGDVIATGTPSGVGFVRKPQPIFLKPKDIVEAEIEGIGILRNPVSG
jgi:2-keto-4-pentenoate hydratase/2-oxohepta-3-ene-1,7-dioic acid hydratase in catechol pathway